MFNFRQFLEEEEKKGDYVDSLEDEMGMSWHDITNALSGEKGTGSSATEPWVSSHFSLGSPQHELRYKLSPWKIVKGSLEQGAGGSIMLVPGQKNNQSYLHGGKAVNKSDKQDAKQYYLKWDDLLNFLTTGWTPAIQQNQQQSGGMPGGMPGI